MFRRHLRSARRVRAVLRFAAFVLLFIASFAPDHILALIALGYAMSQKAQKYLRLF